MLCKLCLGKGLLLTELCVCLCACVFAFTCGLQPQQFLKQPTSPASLTNNQPDLSLKNDANHTTSTPDLQQPPQPHNPTTKQPQHHPTTPKTPNTSTIPLSTSTPTLPTLPTPQPSPPNTNLTSNGKVLSSKYRTESILD